MHHPSIHTSIHLSIHLIIYPFKLPIYLSIHPSIHPSNGFKIFKLLWAYQLRTLHWSDIICSLFGSEGLWYCIQFSNFPIKKFWLCSHVRLFTYLRLGPGYCLFYCQTIILILSYSPDDIFFSSKEQRSLLMILYQAICVLTSISSGQSGRRPFGGWRPVTRWPKRSVQVALMKCRGLLRSMVINCPVARSSNVHTGTRHIKNMKMKIALH